MHRVEPAATPSAAGLVGELWDELADALAGQAEPVAEAGRLLLARIAARFSADGSIRSVLADAAGNPVVHLPLWLAAHHGHSSETARDIARAVLLRLVGAVAASDAEMPEALVIWARDFARSVLPDRPPVPGAMPTGGRPDDPMAELFSFVAALCGRWLGDHRSGEACLVLGDALVFERDVAGLAGAVPGDELTAPAAIVVEHLGGMAPSRPLLAALAIPTVSGAVLAAWDRRIDEAAAAWAGVDEAKISITGLRTRRQAWDSMVEQVSPVRPQAAWWGRREPAVVDRTSRAIAMAEAYLLAPGAIRSTWIEQRRGMAGHDRVVAPFPAGLVLEVLSRRGCDVIGRTDDHIAALRAQHYAFYDAPELRYVDTDTLGSLLRIFRWSSRDPVVRKELTALVEETLARHPDEIPVWLQPPAHDGPITLLGEGCATIEAGFLAGLLGTDLRVLFPLAAAERLLGDFVSRGVGISVNYPGAMLVAVMRRLLDEMEEAGLTTAAAPDVRRRISIETERLAGSESAQTAAWLLVAGAPGEDDASQRRWVETILSLQRYDGGWDGEPIFFVTGLDGEPEWYRNRVVTTAFCYDALRSVAG